MYAVYRGPIRVRLAGNSPDDFFDLVCAENGIHFGKVGAYLHRVSLSQATCDNKLPARPGSFQLRGGKNGLDRFLFRVRDEAAGVYNEDIRICGIRGQNVPPCLQQADHDLAVDLVFGTP
jgi:hypothetical protein